MKNKNKIIQLPTTRERVWDRLYDDMQANYKAGLLSAGHPEGVSDNAIELCVTTWEKAIAVAEYYGCHIKADKKIEDADYSNPQHVKKLLTELCDHAWNNSYKLSISLVEEILNLCLRVCYLEREKEELKKQMNENR